MAQAVRLILVLEILGVLSRSSANISVPRIRGPNIPNGPVAKRRLFEKYSWNPTGQPQFRKASVSYSSVPARVVAIPEEEHAEYLSPVTVGGQTFNVNFDTGSADFWLLSSYLGSSIANDHSLFNPDQSATFRNLTGATWSINYADHSGAAGVVGCDQVVVGAATATSQAVQLATSLSPGFITDSSSDGVLGLGFSILNTVKPNKQNTVFDNLKAVLPNPIFAVDLEEDGSGFYEFGVIDPTQYVGYLTRIPVDNSSGRWQIQSTVFSIGNGPQVLNLAASPAVIDTGTSLLVVDDAVAQQYYSQVPNSYYSITFGGWAFPCQNILPSFTVYLGSAGFSLAISGIVLNYSQLSGSYCFGSIQGNEGYPFQIYGDILFRSAYVVFDMSSLQPSIAIAAKASVLSTISSSPSASLVPLSSLSRIPDTGTLSKTTTAANPTKVSIITTITIVKRTHTSSSLHL